MTAATLAPLHLHHHLSPGHLNLLVFHALAALLHRVDLLFVTSLFSLPLLPLLVSDTGHDLHALLRLLLLFVNAFLLMIFNLLLVSLALLFHQTLLQPVFESLVALLLLYLFVQALSFFLPEHVLLL